MLSFFPRDVLDAILDIIESVFEGFSTHYIQRRATRFCCNDYRRSSIDISMLQELGWEDLKSRRGQNKVTMKYRIVNNLVEILAGQYLIYSHKNSNKRTSSPTPANTLFDQCLQGRFFFINSPPLAVIVNNVFD